MKTTIIKAVLFALVGAGCATGGGGKPTGPENAPEEPAAKTPPKPTGDLAPMVAAGRGARREMGAESEDAWVAAVEKAQKMLAEPKPNCSGAAGVFESFAGKNPKVASAWYNAGLAYLKCDDLRAAEKAYRK